MVALEAAGPPPGATLARKVLTAQARQKFALATRMLAGPAGGPAAAERAEAFVEDARRLLLAADALDG